MSITRWEQFRTNGSSSGSVYCEIISSIVIRQGQDFSQYLVPCDLNILVVILSRPSGADITVAPVEKIILTGESTGFES